MTFESLVKQVQENLEAGMRTEIASSFLDMAADFLEFNVKGEIPLSIDVDLMTVRDLLEVEMIRPYWGIIKFRTKMYAWVTRGDDTVCEECKSLSSVENNRIYTAQEVEELDATVHSDMLELPHYFESKPVSPRRFEATRKERRCRCTIAEVEARIPEGKEEFFQNEFKSRVKRIIDEAAKGTAVRI